jgi:hypothetical protein
MAELNDNVVVLTDRRVDTKPAMHQGAARVALEQLDELGWRLRELFPRSSWSAQQWMIASTPFRMELTRMRSRLDDLANISTGSEYNAIQWVFEFNDARLEAERRLHEIGMSLQSLQCPEISQADRIRETNVFAVNRPGLLTALGRIQHMIATQFPAALNDSSKKL